MRTPRLVLGGGGVALILLGAWLLAFDTAPGTAPWVAVWLAGAVVVHDLLLAPLVQLAGRLLGRPPGLGLWRGAFLVAGTLTLVALPPLLRPGQDNPSLLPLDYGRNWSLLLVFTALVALSLRWGRRLKKYRS